MTHTCFDESFVILLFAPLTVPNWWNHFFYHPISRSWSEESRPLLSFTQAPRELRQDQRSALGWGAPCPLRPVYPAQKWIFAQCSRNAGDDGASEGNVFIEPRRHRAGRGSLSHLLHPTLCLSPDTAHPASSGALGSPSIDSLQTHNLAFWRRFGGSLLARISSRSKWLKIWSILACRSFSNTWVLRKREREKLEDCKQLIFSFLLRKWLKGEIGADYILSID